MFGIDYKVLLNGSGISGDQEDRLNELAKEGYRLVAVGPKGFLFLERNKDAFELFNLGDDDDDDFDFDFDYDDDDDDFDFDYVDFDYDDG